MEIPEHRSRIMRAIRSRDTTPEMLVRRMLHAAGYRFRLSVKSLPGCPDLVFPSRRKIIFVNGCFWHGHSCPRGARVPKKNRGYWVGKVARNRERDNQNLRKLRALGWRTLTVWECRVKSITLDRLRKFLD
jgi:DNA mismatch endonuclease (patch repair protein)